MKSLKKLFVWLIIGSLSVLSLAMEMEQPTKSTEEKKPAKVDRPKTLISATLDTIINNTDATYTLALIDGDDESDTPKHLAEYPIKPGINNVFIPLNLIMTEEDKQEDAQAMQKDPSLQIIPVFNVAQPLIITGLPNKNRLDVIIAYSEMPYESVYFSTATGALFKEDVSTQKDIDVFSETIDEKTINATLEHKAQLHVSITLDGGAGLKKSTIAVSLNRIISPKVEATLLALHKKLAPNMPTNIVGLVLVELLENEKHYTREERINIALAMANDPQFKSIQRQIIDAMYGIRELAWSVSAPNQTPFFYAVIWNYSKLEKILGQKDQRFLVTLLSLIKDNKPTSEVETFIRNQQIDLNNYSYQEDITPLIQAIEQGNIDVVNLILKMGADPNKLNPLARTILLNDQAKRHAIVKLLLKAKAKIKPNIFNMAIRIRGNDDPETIKMLLDHGAKSPVALIEAVEKGNVELVKLLLHKNINIGYRDRFGNTALIIAAKPDYEKEKKEIKDIAAREDLEHTVKQNMLQVARGRLLAAQSKATQIVKLLLKSKADVNAQDDAGRTVLMLAAQNDNLDMVEELLAYGADVTLKNEKGKTALEFATDPSTRWLLEDAMHKQVAQKMRTLEKQKKK